MLHMHVLSWRSFPCSAPFWQAWGLLVVAFRVGQSDHFLQLVCRPSTAVAGY
jgi:hypothetical protein